MKCHISTIKAKLKRAKKTYCGMTLSARGKNPRVIQITASTKKPALIPIVFFGKGITLSTSELRTPLLPDHGAYAYVFPCSQTIRPSIA
mmetsp:Transcript_15649/g.24908  ORF Transcript_15649/g.24908 Transcript_15649/m.24908 type:complete len:89 (+) Transcript_15649:117-383(+)